MPNELAHVRAESQQEKHTDAFLFALASDLAGKVGKGNMGRKC